MNKTLIVVVTGIASLASIGLAQEDKDYQTWMKTVASTNGTLRKNVEAKMGDAAAADADKIAGAFKQITAFWEKRGAADAVAAAQKAATAAGDISTAAKAGNWDQASGAVMALGGTCGGCHRAHREGTAQEGFKIK